MKRIGPDRTRMRGAERAGRRRDRLVLATSMVWSLAAFAATPPSLAATESSASFDTPAGLGAPSFATKPPEPGDAAADDPKQTEGNPLWAVPLSSLTATQQRPILLPSRRPPAPSLPSAAATPPPVTASAPAEEKPALNLVGVVSGGGGGLAVFTNTLTRDTVRLRMGEGHDGWILLSVQGREAVLEKDRRTAVFTLPPLTGDQK